MAFTCQICFEQQEEQQRLSLPRLATGNGDILRHEDCNHPICQQCLSTWVTTRVQEQFVFNLRCPFVGCTNELFEQDLVRLVQSGDLPTSTSEHFAELRTRDYSARAEALSSELASEQDLGLLLRIWETTRLCPRCNLAIERSEGCNSFYCICGHHFDYSTAPRILGNGIKRYGTVIATANSTGISLREAEKYGSDTTAAGKQWTKSRALAVHHDVSQLSKEASLEMDEAWELYQQARSGDKDAQTRIRAARGRDETAGQATEEEEEEDVPLMLHWDDEDLGSTFLEAPNAPDVDANLQEDDVIEALHGNVTTEGPEEREDNFLESNPSQEPMVISSQVCKAVKKGASIPQMALQLLLSYTGMPNQSTPANATESQVMKESS